jgi:hypothetical protein
MSKRRSSDSNLCRMLYFTVMAVTLWSATLMNDSTDVTSVLKNRPVAAPCVTFCTLHVL